MTVRLLRWLTIVPKTIPAEERRAYHVALLASGVGALFHLVFLTVVTLFDVRPLVYVNIGSVAFYALLYVLVRRTGRSGAAMILVTVELILHQVVAIYYLGWGYGFQFYLPLVAGFVFMGHHRRLIAPSLCAVASVLALGWLYFYGQYLLEPHLTMPESVRVGLYWWNITGASLGFAFGAAAFARTARRMERELADQNLELRETQAALVESEKVAAMGKLTAGVTHEINTPIGTILSSVDTAGRAVERLRGGADARLIGVLDESLRGIAAAASRLSEIVARLQSLVRLDEAEVQLADLHDGISGAIGLVRDQTERKRIRVVDALDRTVPRVLCRPAEINQIVMHLLQNAIDAIDDGGSITISTRHDAERVYVAVADTGRGVEPRELGRLFDPGFSGSARVKLGLGLAASRQMAAHHHGEITVESTPSVGSTFTLALPKRTSTSELESDAGPRAE